MKINIIWGKYVVYDYGQVNIAGFIGETSIDIKNKSGTVISELVINTTERTIIKLPVLSKTPSYNIEIDDGSVVSQTPLPTEDPSAERDGIKISELQSTSHLEPRDIFALSRDEGQDGSYDRTLHVTLADLIAAIKPAEVVTHTLTVNNSDGGQVFPLTPENHQAGEDVVAGINMDPAYNFLSWTSDWPDLNESTETSLSFQMPAQNVTLTANVEPVTHTLTVNNSDGGQVFPLTPENHQAGENVVAGINMDPAYNFLSWTSDWPDLNESTETSLSFQMPAQNVTLTANVELADQSIWDNGLDQSGPLGKGWGAYDPNELRYSDETQKTTNPDDFMFYNSSNDTFVYTSIATVTNEWSWVKEEIQNSNFSNLLLQYIDESGNVLQNTLSEQLQYTGDTLQDQWFGYSNNVIDESGIKRLGINGSGTVYFAMQYDQPYTHVQIRLTNIATGEILISRKIIVYSGDDPVFGLD